MADLYSLLDVATVRTNPADMPLRRSGLIGDQ